jgi:SAM-dependent methyltransferase
MIKPLQSGRLFRLYKAAVRNPFSRDGKKNDGMSVDKQQQVYQNMLLKLENMPDILGYGNEDIYELRRARAQVEIRSWYTLDNGRRLLRRSQTQLAPGDMALSAAARKKKTPSTFMVDLGCGTGAFLIAMAWGEFAAGRNTRFLGIDKSAKVITAAKALIKGTPIADLVDFQVGDVTDLGSMKRALQGNPVDIWYADLLFAHLQNAEIETMLRVISSLSQPGKTLADFHEVNPFTHAFDHPAWVLFMEMFNRAAEVGGRPLTRGLELQTFLSEKSLGFSTPIPDLKENYSMKSNSSWVRVAVEAVINAAPLIERALHTEKLDITDHALLEALIEYDQSLASTTPKEVAAKLELGGRMRLAPDENMRAALKKTRKLPLTKDNICKLAAATWRVMSSCQMRGFVEFSGRTMVVNTPCTSLPAGV